ncbi:MAG: EthD family reductase [Actinobacteria bacterium]|nr:EthD family reductase [Actinomycetota bacterium]
MIKLTVLYGQPKDPQAFDSHYRNTHIPLAAKIPDVKRFEAAKVTGTPDGSSPTYYLIAELLFDDMDHFHKSMGSPAGQAAAQDVGNFATGGVTFLISETFE